jgi:hypothetical protein
MPLNFFYIWFGVMIAAIIIAPLKRKMLGQKPAQAIELEFVGAGFALGGAIALIKVLIKLVMDTKLQADLDLDGSIALGISSLLGIYLSLKEFLKVF